MDDFLRALIDRGASSQALRLLTALAEVNPLLLGRLHLWRAAVFAVQDKPSRLREAVAEMTLQSWRSYLAAADLLSLLQPEAMARLIAAAVADAPRQPLALARLLQIQSELQQWTPAVQTFARLEALDQTGPLEQLIAFDALIHGHRWREAQQLIGGLSVHYEPASAFQAMMASLCAQIGRADDARVRFLRCDQMGLETYGSLTHLVHAACTLDDPALMRRCLHLVVTTTFPDSPAHPIYVDPDGFAELIEAFARQGLRKEALLLARLATRKMPGDHAAQTTLAQLLISFGRHREAAQAYAAALRAKPGDLALELAHAMSLLDAGQVKESIAPFRGVLKKDANSQAAIAGLVAALKHRQGGGDELLRLLWRAHELQPHSRTRSENFLAAARHSKQLVWRRHASALTTEIRAADDRGLCQVGLPGAKDAPAAAAQVDFTFLGERRRGLQLGVSYDNRVAVQEEDGSLYWLRDGLVGRSPVRGASASLARGRAYSVSGPLAGRIQSLYQLSVVNGARVTDFCRSMSRSGGESFLVGGALRDLIHAGPEAAVGDLDLGVSLPANLVRMACGSLAGDVPGLPQRPNGVVSSHHLEFFGLVKWGVYRGGAAEARLDIMSLRTFGALEPRRRVCGVRQEVLPVAFGPDLYQDALFRDFTLNALYHDAGLDLIFDPLGTGVQDAAAGRLILCSREHIARNETLGWRYIKMRQRGFVGPTQTRRDIREHFRLRLEAPDTDKWLRRSFARVFPRATDAASIGPIAELIRDDRLASEALVAALHNLPATGTVPEVEHGGVAG